MTQTSDITVQFIPASNFSNSMLLGMLHCTNTDFLKTIKLLPTLVAEKDEHKFYFDVEALKLAIGDFDRDSGEFQDQHIFSLVATQSSEVLAGYNKCILLPTLCIGVDSPTMGKKIGKKYDEIEAKMGDKPFLSIVAELQKCFPKQLIGLYIFLIERLADGAEYNIGLLRLELSGSITPIEDSAAEKNDGLFPAIESMMSLILELDVTLQSTGTSAPDYAILPFLTEWHCKMENNKDDLIASLGLVKAKPTLH